MIKKAINAILAIITSYFQIKFAKTGAIPAKNRTFAPYFEITKKIKGCLCRHLGRKATSNAYLQRSLAILTKTTDDFTHIKMV